MSIDPTRLVVSAHELAHAYAYKAAGMQVTGIRVEGSGPGNVWGRCPTEVIDDPTDEQVEGYLVGLKAGRVADDWMCRELGLGRRNDSHFVRDAEAWAEHRHLAPRLSESQAEVRAARIVRANWSRIAKLAPVLAVKGLISEREVV